MFSTAVGGTTKRLRRSLIELTGNWHFANDRRKSLANSKSNASQMKNNRHFKTVSSWKEAEALLIFEPLKPAITEGFELQSIAVHVRDHKHRELPVSERSLELHYEGFVLTQVSSGEDEARRLTLEVSYGRAPLEGRIASHEARVYELGPEPEQGDIDPRNPAVVVWHDAKMFFLIASDKLTSDVLVRIAISLY